MNQYSSPRAHAGRGLVSFAVVALALLAVLAGLVFLYARYLAPTRVALVNYPGFQAAKFEAAEDTGWVSVERFSGEDYSALADYDVILIFGRGLALNEQALETVRALVSSRVVYVDAPTNPAHEFNSVPPAHRELVTEYIDNAGSQNYQNLLRYFRADIQGRLFGVREALPPREIASDVLFHLGPNAIFEDLASYEQYYARVATYVRDGPKVALVTTVPGPFNANRDHIDALIRQLEAEGYRVYPLASTSRRLSLLQKIGPDIVVLMPHGRLHVGDAMKTVAWLKRQNIPLLAPLSVFQQYEDWLADPQGYQGGLLSMNVVLPELDGAIAPFVINAQFDSETEAGIFKTVPGRLERFIGLLNGFVDLKAATNADKKLGIVYFRGPGKNALTAGNMEVARSLYNTLGELQAQGYNLSGLPGTFAAFQADLDRQGLVMSPRAPGQIEDFLAGAEPAFLDVAQYRGLCQALAADLCQQVESLYGPAPGDYLVNDNGIAVARLQYGNVALLPQPLPGYGSDTFALVHGTDKPPPHTYLAAYFWLRHVFGADALMHFGTHGSLEFTPSKQVALSGADWADALVGGIPHFYLYTMSNVGEAIIAKRRSYATIINHLTPPFARAGLDTSLSRLQRELASYAATEGAVREQSRVAINQLVRELDLDKDLALEQAMLDSSAEWDEQVRLPLTQWLESVASEKITQGLYTLGESYTDEQSQRTAALMFADTLSAHIAQLETLGGEQVSQPRPADVIAGEWIGRAREGVRGVDLLLQAYPVLYPDIQGWRKANPVVSDMDIVRGFVALKDTSSAAPNEGRATLSDEQLQDLLIGVMADPDALDFLSSLEDERRFSHVSKTLSPGVRERARALARVIPAIGTALEQLSKPEVESLVTQMQSPEVRRKVIDWLNTGDFETQVREARQRRLAGLVDAAGVALGSIDLEQSDAAFQRADWRTQKATIAAARSFQSRYLEQPEVEAAVAELVLAHSGLEVAEFAQRLGEMTRRQEAIYSQTTARYQSLSSHFADIETLLAAVPRSADFLARGGEIEFAALSNALAGGYVEPAPGGDPVLNPQALPTGRNMYSIDAEKMPSESAWKVGVAMAQELMDSHRESSGTALRKAAFTLWPSSFIHSEGATVAEILYLLGVEPQRDPFGRIQSLRLIPQAELGRPRVDVVVQSAGQLRDLAASRLALIEEAVAMAAGAGDQGDNFVRAGVRAAEQYLLEQGQSPMAAKSLALRRSFGGVNNSYGTGIMGLVEESERWESRHQIASQYLKNMGAVYGDSASWGEFNQSLYAAALLNTEVIVQPRSSNTWGALSLDHVYEFMGGLSAAVTEVTGTSPAAFFNDFRNSARARLTSLEQTLWLEARSSLLNPAFISGLTEEGGASSAEVFAETFRNTFGWSSMREEAIDDALWNQLHEVYVRDRHQLGLQGFFRRENPYALQEMSGVMLEASRKGFWDATREQQQELATLHAQLVADYEAGCGSFTCGNPLLREYIEGLLTESDRADYSKALDQAELGEETARGLVLVEQGAQTGSKQEVSPERASSEQSSPSQVDSPVANSVPDRSRLLIGLLVALGLAAALLIAWRLHRGR